MGALSPSGDYLRTSAENGVTVSRCVYCQQIVGAGKEIDKVEIAENSHGCPGKRDGHDGVDGAQPPPKIPAKSERRRKVTRSKSGERNG
jgi:hypothetical protein